MRVSKRVLLVALLLSVLAVGVVLAAPAKSPEQIHNESLNCLTSPGVEAIRAHPTRMRGAFAACDSELARKVPFARSEAQRHAVFATLVSYRMAPYGLSHAIELPSLLRAKAMNCANYGWFVFHLVRRGWGEREALHLWQSGWDHGAIGNHAQVHLGNLLLDPTIGAVAQVGYSELLHGVPARSIVVFPHRDDIDAFATRVTDALAGGLYRPADVLYTRDYANWRHPHSSA